MCHPSVTFPKHTEHQEGGTGRRPALSLLTANQRLSGSKCKDSILEVVRSSQTKHPVAEAGPGENWGISALMGRIDLPRWR